MRCYSSALLGQRLWGIRCCPLRNGTFAMMRLLLCNSYNGTTNVLIGYVKSNVFGSCDATDLWSALITMDVQLLLVAKSKACKHIHSC
jgi:hypothetical protein